MTWYDSQENVHEMARWMADHDASAQDVVAMLEKPWRFGWAWENRDNHITCGFELDCKARRCERCHTLLPECHLILTEIGYDAEGQAGDDLYLCQKCRETPTGGDS